MIKAIKVKKEMTFLQLIEAASRYKLHDGGYREYPSDCMRYVVRLSPEELDYVKDVKAEDHLGYYPNIPYDTTFTIEEEEEITEDTEFEALVFILVSGRIEVINNYHNIRSARSLIENYETEKQIYALVNGKLQLIWGAENSERN